MRNKQSFCKKSSRPDKEAVNLKEMFGLWVREKFPPLDLVGCKTAQQSGKDYELAVQSPVVSS